VSEDVQESRQNLTPRKRAFLASFSLCGNISQACRDSEVSRPTVYEWLKYDPDFRPLFEDAKEVACDILEEEARRRACEGVQKPVFGSLGHGAGSGQIGTVREYSDTLMIFLLKAARPEKYRERVDTRHSGGIGVVSVQIQASVGEALKEPDYLEYLEQRALAADRNAGVICPDVQSGEVGAGSTPDQAQPGDP